MEKRRRGRPRARVGKFRIAVDVKPGVRPKYDVDVFCCRSACFQTDLNEMIEDKERNGFESRTPAQTVRV